MGAPLCSSVEATGARSKQQRSGKLLKPHISLLPAMCRHPCDMPAHPHGIAGKDDMGTCSVFAVTRKSFLSSAGMHSACGRTISEHLASAQALVHPEAVNYGDASPVDLPVPARMQHSARTQPRVMRVAIPLVSFHSRPDQVGCSLF